MPSYYASFNTTEQAFSGNIGSQGSLADPFAWAQQVYQPAFSFTDTMDGLNDYRSTRVGELLEDFRNLQHWITSTPYEPPFEDDYYTEGWAALRQCAIDGHFILECAADTSVPEAASEEEQTKAELKQILLDAYARRHEGQKIYSRQQAAQRWIEMREQVLQGGRPSRRNQAQLMACDQQLRAELAQINDDVVYVENQVSDQAMGRWTAEDPSLRSVQRWLRRRRA